MTDTAAMSTLIGPEALRLMHLAVAADGHARTQEIGDTGVVVLASHTYEALGGDDAVSELTRLRSRVAELAKVIAREREIYARIADECVHVVDDYPDTTCRHYKAGISVAASLIARRIRERNALLSQSTEKQTP